MNRIITQPKRRSRAVVGSTIAMLVALPLSVALGLGASASAGAGDGDKAPAGTSQESSPGGEGTELGKAKPWPPASIASAEVEAAAAEQYASKS
jgi:hypothetical protein